jgi:hypothetical protein
MINNHYGNIFYHTGNVKHNRILGKLTEYKNIYMNNIRINKNV